MTPYPIDLSRAFLIDQTSQNTVYLALGGFEPDNLWRTTDGGGTWQDITGLEPDYGGLPEVPLRGIARHPNDSNKIYIGTEIGVYVGQNNAGSWTWKPVVDGPANVAVSELTFMHNSTKLLAATYGRGFWISDVDSVVADPTLYDFDNDGRADPAVFRPSNGTWYLKRSTAGFYAQQHGLSTDTPVAEDYDGDEKADLAVFRVDQQTGLATWYWIRSTNGTLQTLQFGLSHDVPVPADFDNDGHADQAIFRVEASGLGYWHLNRSNLGYIALQWGAADDYPFAADFSSPADGYADLGIFRLKEGEWWLYTTGTWFSVQWGLETDIPVAADYDGDGTADVAVYRPGTNIWYLIQSTNGFKFFPWGTANDVPVPADYDGDGRADIAVWRPGDGFWHMAQSSSGYRAVQFGASGDFPIPKHLFTSP